jgi:hypothetical protein
VIDATFKLDWRGPEYSRRLHTLLVAATKRGAEVVRRRVKEVELNTSGKAITDKMGVNRGTVVQRYHRGNNALINRGQASTTKTKKGSLKTIVVGSMIVKGKQNRKRNYRIDRVYWYGEPLFRWVQSSPPGSPPHKQTGTLQRSIAVESTHSGLRAKVGPGRRLKYARIQELGGRGLLNLPPRPYMQPAFQASIGAILFQYELAIARASK